MIRAITRFTPAARYAFSPTHLYAMGRSILPTRSFSPSLARYGGDDYWTACENDDEIDAIAKDFKSPFSAPTTMELSKKMAQELEEEAIYAISNHEAKIALDAIERKYPKFNTALTIASTSHRDTNPSIESLLESAKSSDKPTIALILLSDILDGDGVFGHFFTVLIDRDQIFLVDNNGREKYRQNLCDRPYPGHREYNVAKENIILALEKYSHLPVQTNEIPTFDQSNICGFAALKIVLEIAKQENPMRFLQQLDLLDTTTRRELFSTDGIKKMPTLVTLLRDDIARQESSPSSKLTDPDSLSYHLVEGNFNSSR